MFIIFCLPGVPRGGVVTVVSPQVGRAGRSPGAAERLRRPLVVPGWVLGLVSPGVDFPPLVACRFSGWGVSS